MRIFGLEIARIKAHRTATAVDTRAGWFGVISEIFTGAWQQMVRIDAPKDILASGAVFACATKPAGDIAKMRPKLVKDNDDGTCTEVEGTSPFREVLEKPNHFQTRIKFFQHWILSKLLHGNMYALKQRDARGLVRRLYILDPTRVTPLVTNDGDVYYQLAADHLSGLQEMITVPAREIIHDLMWPLWHPLVGVAPIYACGLSATMANKIQRNSTRFFDNLSRPSGYLQAPGKLDDEDAKKLKDTWQQNYGGENFGKTAVLANGLKYETIGVPAQQAQLVEQLRWTVEDVARCFHMPLYKIGGPVPQNTSVEALDQQYYSECLQVLIEDMELCLQEGLALPPGYYVEFDLDGLLRMDSAALHEALKNAVGAGYMAPNEARKRVNLPPAKGGEGPYLQQQNFSLEALAKRDAKADPFGKEKPADSTPPAANDERMDAAEARSVFRLRVKGAG